jgi:excisionase family DNA binding protein
MNLRAEPMTYKVEEAAKLLRIGRNQAYDAVACGEIPSIRIGKRILVPRVALERMLAVETKAVAA